MDIIRTRKGEKCEWEVTKYAEMHPGEMVRSPTYKTSHIEYHLELTKAKTSGGGLTLVLQTSKAREDKKIEIKPFFEIKGTGRTKDFRKDDMKPDVFKLNRGDTSEIDHLPPKKQVIVIYFTPNTKEVSKTKRPEYVSLPLVPEKTKGRGDGSDSLKSSSHHSHSMDSDDDSGEQIIHHGGARSTSYYNYNKVADDSKPAPEYVGLRNQGATCYMNSMLQSLYHIPAFRRLVYQFPTTGSEDVEKSIPLNLQRLFCRMQLSKTAPSTKALTKSFGWGDAETFTQHDVHEFCRVLLDNIETKLKGTPLQDCISDLFRGKICSFIRGTTVKFETKKVEEFYDLQLLVKGCPNLDASFQKYLEKELLSGKNQYKTEEHGLIDVEIGTEFVELPKVLQLHLRRFDYDFQTGHQVKIYDSFEFPPILDMGKYLPAGSQVEDAKYELFGVIVHSGTVYGGHYYSYLRTSTDPQWFCFNDTQVTRVSDSKAIDDNFGSKPSSMSSPSNYYRSYGYGTMGGKTYSAYILLYVRQSDAAVVYDAIPNDFIPQHLVDYVENAKEEDYGTSRYNELETTVVTQNGFVQNVIRNKMGFINPTDAKTLTVSSKITCKDLYELIAKEINRPSTDFLLIKGNYMKVPTTILSRTSATAAEYGYATKLSLFVLDTTETPTAEMIVVWPVFFFSEHSNPLQPLAPMIIKVTDPVGSIFEKVNEAVGFPKDMPLKVYQETNAHPKELNPTETFRRSFLNTGAILFFEPKTQEIPPTNYQFIVPDAADAIQTPLPEGLPIYTKRDFEEHHEPLTIASFISSQKTFDAAVYDFNDSEHPKFGIRVPTTIDFKDLKDLIAKASGFSYNPQTNSMELYQSDLQTAYPVDQRYSLPNSQFNKSYLKEGEFNKIYFDFHPSISEANLVNTSSYMIWYSQDGCHVNYKHKMRIVKNPTSVDVLKAMRDENIIDDSEHIVAMVSQSSIQRILKPDEKFYYSTSPILVLKKTESLMTDDNSMLLPVTHVKVNSYDTLVPFGEPFYIKVSKDEPFSSVRGRILALLDGTDEEKGTYKFAYGHTYSRWKDLPPIADDKVLFTKSLLRDTIIINYGAAPVYISSTSSYSYHRAEVPVKIYN